MIRIFRAKTFYRWMRKNGVSDDDLRQAVMEMNEGLIDADLGGGVFKKRIHISKVLKEITYGNH